MHRIIAIAIMSVISLMAAAPAQAGFQITNNVKSPQTTNGFEMTQPFYLR